MSLTSTEDPIWLHFKSGRVQVVSVCLPCFCLFSGVGVVGGGRLLFELKEKSVTTKTTCPVKSLHMHTDARPRTQTRPESHQERNELQLTVAGEGDWSVLGGVGS